MTNLLSNRSFGLEKFHKQLTERYPWYKRWHEDEHRSLYHIILFVGITSIMFLLLVNYINQYSVEISMQSGLAKEQKYSKSYAKFMKEENDARIPVNEQAYLPENIYATGDNRIDALLSGYSVSWGRTVTYSFYEDSVFNGSYYSQETGVREVSEGIKRNVRQILGDLQNMSNLNFIEVTETTSTVGQLRFMFSKDATYAYAYYPFSSAAMSTSMDVHLNSSYDHANDANGFQNGPGMHGYSALVHEIGHTLGLKHPHNGSPTMAAENDNNTKTIMSYNFWGNSPSTFMGLDLLALNYSYGTKAHRTAFDNYKITRGYADQYLLGGLTYPSNPAGALKQAVHDTGGLDLIDLSTLPAGNGYRVDLNPLGWITARDAYKNTYYEYGITLGPNTVIADVAGSPGNDVFYANSNTNVFKGYSLTSPNGNDEINGSQSNDTLDLSAFSQVTKTQTGSDLVVGLGDKGSVTVKNYYAGSPIQIKTQQVASKPPVVKLSSSVSSTYAPSNIKLVASASDPDGTITKVEFYNYNALLYSDVAPAYGYTTTNVPGGTYVFTAKAYDNSGLSTVSDPITVTILSGSCIKVNPTVTLTPSSTITSVAGTRQTYQVTMRNNNIQCPGVKYYLSYSLPEGFKVEGLSTLGLESVYLDAEKQSTRYIYLTSPTTATTGDYKFTLRFWDSTDTNYSTAVTGSYVIGSTACTKTNPSVSVSPSTASGAPGTARSYTVTVKNNNSQTCPTVKYVITFEAPTNFWFLGDINLELASGATSSKTFAITPSSSSALQTYSISFRVSDSSNYAYSSMASTSYTVVETNSGGFNLTITNPISTGSYSSGATIPISAQTDVSARITLYFDGAFVKSCTAVKVCTTNYPAGVSAGSHTVTVVAIDSSNNKIQKNVTFFVN